MPNYFLAAAIVLAWASAPLAAQPEDAANFEQVCTRVSTNDQMPQSAIASFCTCLTNKAKANDSLRSELEKAALSEPVQEKRMQMLTPVAQQAVEACRAAIPNGK